MNASDFAQRSPHEVMNQPQPLEDYNLLAGDLPLQEALVREGAAWALDDIRRFGAELGSRAVLELGDLANRFEPELITYDRHGRRVDQVRYHPAYHELMRIQTESGFNGLPWSSDRPGRYVARAAAYHLKHQVEQGTSCPGTMTFAVIPSLRVQPELAAQWEPLATAPRYDPRFLPAAQKQGVLFGMAMTERQGGSDVRSNATKATPASTAGPGQPYLLDGHKWFCSAPMCDAFLVLAQAAGGLSCFLVPRHLPDESVNPFRIERLKSKLGNRSNASSEIRFEGTMGWLVGEEGRGVATIIEMVRHTRLDCCIGAASLIRRVTAEALHHTAGRFAFGRRLDDQPLMKNVLADLCLESEAATAVAMRLSRAYEEARGDEQARLFSRLATAICKFQSTRKETEVAREALECHGGNGFIEDGPMARLFRESPLNSIWEGSGNVQCLDVLRAVSREPEALQTVLDELALARGGNATYDGWLDGAHRMLGDLADLEYRARHVVEQLALGLQASLLVRHAPAAVSEAFVASRLGGAHGQAFGTLPRGTDVDSIIDRSRPVTS